MPYQLPSREELRSLAAGQGLEPSDEDLDGVAGFLAVLLPALEEIERSLGPDVVPVGTLLP